MSEATIEGEVEQGKLTLHTQVLHFRDPHPRKCCDCDSCGHFPVQCYVRISRYSALPNRCEITHGGRYITEEHLCAPSIQAFMGLTEPPKQEWAVHPVRDFGSLEDAQDWWS